MMTVTLELGSWHLNPSSATQELWGPGQVPAVPCLSFPISKTGVMITVPAPYSACGASLSWQRSEHWPNVPTTEGGGAWGLSALPGCWPWPRSPCTVSWVPVTIQAGCWVRETGVSSWARALHTGPSTTPWGLTTVAPTF